MNHNGQSAVNEALTPDLQRPPWWDVDPESLIQQLSGQLAAQAQEMAAMRVYISRLHQALAQVTGGLPAEEPGEPEPQA